MTDTMASKYDPERVINALYRVANFMNVMSDLHRLLILIMQEAKALAMSDAGSCILYDADNDELYFEAALGEKADGTRSIRIKASEASLAGSCLKERRTIVVNDVATDDRHYFKADQKLQFETRNLIAVPMIFQGQPIGVLEVLNKRSGAYNQADAKIMEILAEQAATAIVNARLVEQNVQQERLAAMGTAISGVAHHMKNVIQTMKGTTGLIQMGLASDNNEIIDKSLPILSRGVARMEQSVQEMLAYSKEREPELEPMNLNSLVAEIIEEAGPVAADKKISLRLQMEDAIEDSLLDKHRIHDTILNLVGNAIEAHDARGNGAYVLARTSLSKDGLLHLVEIEDNGPGMPEEIARKIFEPFFSTKGSKGTGLGLAVARKVAQENGGSLVVRSVPGEGSTFSLRLPVRLLPSADKADLQSED